MAKKGMGGRKKSKKDDKKGPRRPRRKAGFILKKKKCRFCTDKALKIDYLDHQLLRRYTTERGKIIPSRISGSCARHQRKLSKAIKRARSIALLPYLTG